jgi:3-oxoacyl-[acyl-carrier protein] reductase
MKLLEGKVAIITGAARGIGESVALKYAEHGASIAFTYISDGSRERAESLAGKLSAMGVKAKAYQSNAADFSSCESFVNDVLSTFGQIDICVNNAGISKDNLLLRLSPEQWNEVVQVNLNSVFNMCKQVIKPMMKARNGSIINMSSVIGEMGNAGQTSYAATKAGVIGFTKSLAKELGSRNVRCNSVAPGFVETDMTSYLKEGDNADKYKSMIALGRFATGEDIANVCLFLASDLGNYITGQTISACGGMNI